MRSCMKYHGGKYYLRKIICEMMPTHRIYVEPFFGAGHVFFEKAPVEKEIINDLDYDIAHMWNMIKIYPYEMGDILKKLSYDLGTFESKDPFATAGDIDHAVKTFVKYRMSIGGRGKNFANPSKGRTRRGMPDNVSGWLSSIDNIVKNSTRLKDVSIANHSAQYLIKPYLNKPDTLIYLDPPYLPKTRKVKRVYSKEMSGDDHEKLVELIKWAKSNIILSGYDNDLYNTVLSHWNKKVIPIKNHAAGGSKKRTMNEVLWYNYGE